MKKDARRDSSRRGKVAGNFFRVCEVIAVAGQEYTREGYVSQQRSPCTEREGPSGSRKVQGGGCQWGELMCVPYQGWTVLRKGGMAKKSTTTVRTMKATPPTEMTMMAQLGRRAEGPK